MTSSDCILGIDPGRAGALAFLHPQAGLLAVHDMPMLEEQKSAGAKVWHIVDDGEARRLIRLYAPTHCRIEAVHSMPTDGVATAWAFADNNATIRTIVRCLDIPLEAVAPNIWKAALGVPADKQKSKLRSHKLFPNCQRLLSRPDKGEAAMIALYDGMSRGIRFNKSIVPWQE